jgi:spermidine synthase
MKNRSSRLLAIESPIANANVMLRLLEPQDSCHEELREKLYSGTYDRPFVVDNGQRRFLHFDFDAIQSAMELSNPQRLTLAYTRKMMAFLLFNRAPVRILLLGLGGGSLAKFCYSNLPAASITAVELNQDVIALRDEFNIPADDHRFRVINADGAAHISALAHRKDVILADACDRRGMAATLDSVTFYRNARRLLSARGVFVTNLCGDKNSVAAHITKLRGVFGDNLLLLQVRKDGNVIAFGFKGHRPDLHSKQIATNAADLKRQFRLDFPHYARRMVLDSQLPEAQTVRGA